MTSPNGTQVAVVGSANLDIVVAVKRFPAPGETVMGGDPLEIAGGKGLNQAVAAARVASTALVGCVGDDSAGQMLVSRLEQAGVDTRHVRRVATPTGRAFIQVAPDGENSIVVAPAANAELTPEDVQQALDRLRPAVVLAQLEVPLESVLAAANWASEHGARFVLNPSPVQQLPDRLIAVCNPLVVNAFEAAEVLGAAPGTDITKLASGLGSRAASVVVTDGPRGAHVGTSTSGQHVPGQRVEAVDTTGAGDEFAGFLAASLATGGAWLRAPLAPTGRLLAWCRSRAADGEGPPPLVRSPIDHVSRLHKPKRTPTALTATEVNAIRAVIRGWEQSAGTSGPNPDGQLGQIVEVMLGTSARIGEVLAIRRHDLNLTTTPATLRICGTVISRNE